MTPSEFRELRQSFGLSQTDWGRCLDVSRPTIARAESGRLGSPIAHNAMIWLAEAYAAGFVPSDDHIRTVLLAASRRPG